MAQKVSVEMVDDLDGTPDASTVEFALDGAEYTIDLGKENAERLRDTMAEFIRNARRTGGRKRPVSTQPAATRTVTDREQTKAIRDWARNNGFDLAERGRIPAHVVEAFEEAGKKPRKGRAKAKAAAS